MDTTLLSRDTAETRRKRDGKPAGSRIDPRDADQKPINLALQGGGAHGAFTWGVLDRLLEDGRVAVEGISATSAGAMNATVAAYGMSAGGREGARLALANFWRRVSHAAAFSLLQPTWLDRMMGNRSLDNSPAYVLMDMMTRLLSPYQFNPMNYNPLRDLLIQVVDFEAMRAHRCPVKLYLSATNVRTGKVKVFGNDEITADAVLASSCLPFLFQAVEIDGESYWDGGYGPNPPLLRLVQDSAASDLLVVQITPSRDNYVPVTAAAIDRRLDQITANAALNAELAALEWAREKGATSTTIHRIAAEDEIDGLAQRNPADLGRSFIALLHERGRSAADRWLRGTTEPKPVATPAQAEPVIVVEQRELVDA